MVPQGNWSDRESDYKQDSFRVERANSLALSNLNYIDKKPNLDNYLMQSPTPLLRTNVKQSLSEVASEAGKY
jgi:hypothetical protein